MITLCKTDYENVRYLLDGPLLNNYNTLRSVLADPELMSIFAQPVPISGGMIDWITNLSGTAQSYKDLSNEDKGVAKIELTKAMNKFNDKLRELNPKSLDFLNNCIEIPDYDCIFIVNSNGRKRVVITYWGFESAVPGSEKGLISIFVGPKKVSMDYTVYFYDNGRKNPKPEFLAPGVSVLFEYDNNSSTITSDGNAKIVLQGIKEETKVSAYEIEDVDKKSPQVETCWQFGKYNIFVTPKADMHFRVEDQFGNAMSNYQFMFEYAGKNEILTSDSDGRIVLKSVKAQERVDVYQYSGNTDSKNNYNSFLFDFSQDLYRIVIFQKPVAPPPPQEQVPPPEPPQPEEGSLIIKVKDYKGNPMPNSKVTLKYLGKTEVVYADENANVLVHAPAGTHIEVKARYNWWIKLLGPKGNKK